jgi:hypothetical protein
MNTSPKFISVAAIIISLVGLGVTLWSTFISQYSFEHTLKVQEKQEDEDFAKLKLETLMQLTDFYKMMQQDSIQLKTLRLKFEAEPPPVKESIQIRFYAILLFNTYLREVDRSIQWLDHERQDISSYSKETDYKKLIDEKAKLYQERRVRELMSSSMQDSINEFNTQIEIAKKNRTA